MTCCSLNCEYIGICKHYSSSRDIVRECDYAKQIDDIACMRLLKSSRVNHNVIKKASKKVIVNDGVLGTDNLVAIDKDGNKISYAVYDTDRVVTKAEYDEIQRAKQ